MPTASSTLRLVGVELQSLDDVALGQQAHQKTVLQQLNPEKTGRFSLEAWRPAPLPRRPLMTTIAVTRRPKLRLRQHSVLLPRDIA
jgi:hypothetical protein